MSVHAARTDKVVARTKEALTAEAPAAISPALVLSSLSTSLMGEGVFKLGHSVNLKSTLSLLNTCE